VLTRDGLAGAPDDPTEIGPFAWMEGALLADLLDEHDFKYRATASGEHLSGIQTNSSTGFAYGAAYDMSANPGIISPLVDSGFAIRIVVEAAQRQDVTDLANQHKSQLRQQSKQQSQTYYSSAAAQRSKRLKAMAYVLIGGWLAIMVLGVAMNISQR
jgi:hypothetical protein